MIGLTKSFKLYWSRIISIKLYLNAAIAYELRVSSNGNSIVLRSVGINAASSIKLTIEIAIKGLSAISQIGIAKRPMMKSSISTFFIRLRLLACNEK